MAGKGSIRYKDQRKLLDKLLGEDRNGDTELVSRQPYSAPIFCRFYLCGLCPYELFTNTVRHILNQRFVEENSNERNFFCL